MELFTYHRSSAAYRVRIALNHKGIKYTAVPVNLLKAEHRGEDYLRISPQGLVPALRLDDRRVLTQSNAILEWLEENYPEPALLPRDSYDRGVVRSWANIVACDIHPIDNSRVLKYLTGELGVNDEQKQIWYHHWIKLGFDVLEQQILATPYCFGEQISMADVYLIPQVYNALRFNLDMTSYPKIKSVSENCHQLDAFFQAAPENQPDSPT
ncbi:MAG: maleylacetoacetate isomerase [Pseudomonadales bacterium]|nr:maleylacetoacetate isomerase [Pseudomonadales bacterium]